MKNQLNLYRPSIKTTRKQTIKLIGMCLYNLADIRISEQARNTYVSDLMLAMTNIRRGLDRVANVRNKLQWNLKDPEKGGKQ